MYVPKLEFVNNHYNSGPAIRDFINKNLPLLRAPAVEIFRLECSPLEFQPGDVTRWLASTVSPCIRELDIDCRYWGAACLPSSLYTCESLVTLKLRGEQVLVDVPRNVSLPCLKTLVLDGVKYRNKDCFRLLISYCPLLEDLFVERSYQDNAEAIVVISQSLQRLTLPIGFGMTRSGEYVIVTPCLKYFKVEDYNLAYSYFVAHMPNLEEADICVEDDVQNLLDHVTSVKRLSLRVSYDFLERVKSVFLFLIFINFQSLIRFLRSKIRFPFYCLCVQYMYDDGIFFSRLEHLKLCISFDNWSKLLIQLLHDSPNLKVLNLEVSVSFFL